MKNMKVSSKLVVSFLIIVLLTALMGVTGIAGMLNIGASGEGMYNSQTVPLPYLGRAEENLQRIRVYVREMVMASMMGDMAGVEDSFGVIVSLIPVLAENMDGFEDAASNEQALRIFRAARAVYEGELTNTVIAIYAASQISDIPEIMDRLIVCRELSNRIIADFDHCMDIMVDDAQRAYQNSESLINTLLITIIAVLIIAIAAAMGLAFYLSGVIGKPLVALAGFMRNAGSKGDVIMTPENEQELIKYSQSHDEIGQLMKDCGSFIDHVISSAENLKLIANGDLTVDIKSLSDEDTMGKSLEQMIDNLNHMFTDIHASASQVSAGSKQMADGSQALAQGAAEQSAAVEELTASIIEVAEKTRESAGMADEAANLANTIKQSAEKGNNQMNEMMTAVHEINAASQSINKVIKAIDDIAFQTNILALNAAVEAARAGQHGKGFAVVADEVRNLAAKSAEAAKETGVLIQNSVEKAELGARIAGETAASLTEIVSGINESSQIVSEIAQSGEEQSSRIEKINSGIKQVSSVVQQNSATAQQSAATSEEMSGQAAMLEVLISQFKLKGIGGTKKGQ
jgi:methyl-accepting chemotaxis protein